MWNSGIGSHRNDVRVKKTDKKEEAVDCDGPSKTEVISLCDVGGGGALLGQIVEGAHPAER